MADSIFDYSLRLLDESRQHVVTVLETGNGDTAQVISRSVSIDPTQVANGVYWLELVAWDFNHQVRERRSITIDSGELKLGNFSLSFTDLAVPVNGVPITITRSYDTFQDTFQSHRSGDFGYGWQMDFRDVKLQHSLLASGTQIGTGANDGFAYGTRVWITLPGGKREMFEFKPRLLTGDDTDQVTWGIELQSLAQVYVPEFSSRSGSGLTLTVERAYLREMGGQLMGAGTLSAYNPARDEFGGRYYLSTREGLTYTIDAAQGKLLSVTDANGNTLSYSDDSIAAVNPQGLEIGRVTFTRDDQDRITEVFDPAGKRIHYEYDGHGDLVAVTDRTGITTQYRYGEGGAPAHYLTGITDGRGIEVIHAQYDPASRRLTGLVDANGNLVSLVSGTGAGGPSEITTDALGNTTETVYDDRGNTVRVIQTADADPAHPTWARYMVSVSEYDDDNNLTRVGVPFAVLDDPGTSGDDGLRYTQQPAVWSSISTYDPFGHILSETDASGSTTYYSNYTRFGDPTAVTDALGNTTHYSYDESSGQLLTTTDAAGTVGQFRYDERGNPTFVLQTTSSGTITVIQSRYSMSGLPVWIQDSAGQQQEIRCDANGRQIAMSYTGPDGHAIRVEKVYDNEGHLLGMNKVVAGQQVASAGMTYDAAGRLLSSTDQFGRVTTLRYNAKGLVVETRSPAKDEAGNDVVLVVRTAYDANGRTIAVTAPFIEGVTPLADIRLTHTLYDRLGRAVETRAIKGVQIGVTYNGGGQGVDPCGKKTRSCGGRSERRVNTNGWKQAGVDHGAGRHRAAGVAKAAVSLPRAHSERGGGDSRRGGKD